VSEHFDIAVIGSGAAGIAAAVSAARTGAKVLLLDKKKLRARRHWRLQRVDDAVWALR
jgi:thioredoxin reductase